MTKSAKALLGEALFGAEGPVQKAFFDAYGPWAWRESYELWAEGRAGEGRPVRAAARPGEDIGEKALRELTEDIERLEAEQAERERSWEARNGSRARLAWSRYEQSRAEHQRSGQPSTLVAAVMHRESRPRLRVF